MSYLCNRKWGASVAEQVDALDSKSSGVKPVPVRFRPDVQNERGELAYPFFFCLSSTYIRQDCTTTQPTGSVFSILFWLQGSKMLLQYHKNLCRILRYFAMKSDEKNCSKSNFFSFNQFKLSEKPLPKSAFADIISEYLVFFLYCRSFAETFSTFENYKQDLKHPPICDNRITMAW